jgi:hypothetical protein
MISFGICCGSFSVLQYGRRSERLDPDQMQLVLEIPRRRWPNERHNWRRRRHRT